MREILLLIFLANSCVYGWVWECVKNEEACYRREPTTDNSQNTEALYSSLEICRLVCGKKGNLWPLPYNYTQLDTSLVNVDIQNAVFHLTAPSDDATQFLTKVTSYFKETASGKTQSCQKSMYTVVVYINVRNDDLKLHWATNEKYGIKIRTNDLTRVVSINISAITVYGARHGIETLLQLIELDEDNSSRETCFVTIKSADIYDKPAYRHRGLLLDSARNFLSIDIIKKNIIAMGMSKMNVLHWHLSDTQSFPFVSSRLPNVSKFGAYSIDQIYRPNEIKDLIEFAKYHGVWIVPEIDGPAHFGNGWQWGPQSGLGNLVVCHNQQPWRSFCIQPPCGQMNPANPYLYEVLEHLYKDIVDLWHESDVFHMGGDEVFFPCWNSSEEILNYIGRNNLSEEAFLNLWGEFQEKATRAYDRAQGNNRSSIVLWTSSLTHPDIIEKYLSPDRYVIQTWVPKSDPLPWDLINLGYKIIISTKDKWYLDHGFWGTTTFYTWRDIYDNAILTDKSVLGGEVCMWGELVDDNNIEPRVWPRAAAFGERLWTNPVTTSEEAQKRFFVHNRRMTKRGFKTSSVMPNFCVQNEADCYSYLGRPRQYSFDSGF